MAETLLQLWHNFPRVAWCLLYLVDIFTAVVLPTLTMFAVYLLTLRLASGLPKEASVARQRAGCPTYTELQSGNNLDTDMGSTVLTCGTQSVKSRIIMSQNAVVNCGIGDAGADELRQGFIIQTACLN